ncbi:hypothetical protein PVK06_007986 [Gossypium arboreum]|uniref:Uncharacterized protein n=1 Tax=Gossypium arboreum TaxID=29729 RepID=A0ABR0QK05_GOSAR|nr:hypothetical protein PVK06_007986 [Gossypium arboreum]
MEVEEKENEEEKRGEEEEEESEDEGIKKVKGSSRKGSSRKSGQDSAEKKEPVTPSNDRPRRERKVVERYAFFSGVKAWVHRLHHFRPMMILFSLLLFFILQVFIVAVLAIFPLVPKSLSNRAYRLSFMGTACSSVYSLYALYRRPRAWTLQVVQVYFQLVIATKDFIYFIYCLTFVTSHICLKFALIPILCRSLERIAKFLRHNFSHSTLYSDSLDGNGMIDWYLMFLLGLIFRYVLSLPSASVPIFLSCIIFTDAGQYVIRFGKVDPVLKTGPASMIQELDVSRSLTLSELAIAVTLAISLDNDYFSRHGGWGIPFVAMGE